jgi:hypothetical protein
MEIKRPIWFVLLLMGLIMTKEEEIYSKVKNDDCARCEFQQKAENTYSGNEVGISYDKMFFSITFDCTIEDIKQCPVVIHDMSL